MPESRLSVAITTTSDVDDLAEAAILQSRLDVGERQVAFVENDTDDVWEGHITAWRSFDETATHHLVLEADSHPCHDLLAGVEAAVNSITIRSIVSLYTEGKFVEETQKRGVSSWARCPWVIPRAIVIPIWMIGHFVSWTQHNLPSDLKQPAYALIAWAADQHIGIWHTVPSLVAGVSHAKPAAFLGRQKSALAINWHAGAFQPPKFGEDGTVENWWTMAKATTSDNGGGE